MQVIDIGFLGLLMIIAGIDYKTFRVPLWSLVLMASVIIFKAHSNLGELVVNFVLGLTLMISTVYIGDKLMGRETLGGGDVWLAVAMCAFMGFDKFLIAYTVAALLGMVAMMTVHRKFQSFDIAYAPYLTAGAIIAMVIK